MTTCDTVSLLNRHYDDFHNMVEVATRTGHPVPMDTRGWSQIIVSVLTGTTGLSRKKGADLIDGSDVKAANAWEAIDFPRFNGVIKSGTKAVTSDALASLDEMPHLFFVLWDHTSEGEARCRIWCVRPREDGQFRSLCESWYIGRSTGDVSSTNFQLHPPIGKASNFLRNSYGNLEYPLLFCAVRRAQSYVIETYEPAVMTGGLCTSSCAPAYYCQPVREDCDLVMWGGKPTGQTTSV